MNRRLANHWSMTASYSWSRLDGNFDLDYSSVAVFNTSSFIQDGPGTNVDEQRIEIKTPRRSSGCAGIVTWTSSKSDAV